MFILLLLLLYTVITVDAVKSGTYIIASPQTKCPIERHCLSLSQFATNYSHLVRPRTILQLLPGNHSLEVVLAVNEIISFSVLSKVVNPLEKPVIICDLSIVIQFERITDVLIDAIEFSGCVQTKVNGVENFTISASTLSNRVALTTGTALFVSRSTLHIRDSTFTYFCGFQAPTLYHNNHEVASVGVIAFTNSSADILNSIFTDNSHCDEQGVAMSTKSSSVSIANCKFDSHTLHTTYYNSVLLLRSSRITIVGCIFDSNGRNYGVMGGVFRCIRSNVTIAESVFTNNSAKFGGAIYSYTSSVVIYNSSFNNNRATYEGGVLKVGSSTLRIDNSTFSENTAGTTGAVLYTFEMSSILIENSNFYLNKAGVHGGGLCIWKDSKLFVYGQNSFVDNFAAKYGSAIHVLFGSIVGNGSLSIINNFATLESIALLHGNGNFSGVLFMANNTGSLFVFDSDLSITGIIILSNNTPAGNRSTDPDIQEGGGITSFLSTITMNGLIIIQHNCATNGGGILAAASKIFFVGQAFFKNNAASDTGGGIYLYQTELKLQGNISFEWNTANRRGGGMHAIGSSISLTLHHIEHTSSKCYFLFNTAEMGGGICLEVSSKLYVMSQKKYQLYFINNTADYGGAIFVDDETNTGTCTSSPNQTVTEASESECFFQVVTVSSRRTIIEDIVSFSSNSARYSGSFLYGGLLDRCTVNIFGKRNIKYSEQVGSISGICNYTSSAPVRICFCDVHDNLNCMHQPQPMQTVKGQNFSIILTAVDQVNHTVKATIHSHLSATTSRLGKGQRVQVVTSTCTNLTFKAYSKKDKEKLTLYAEGPCKYIGISKSYIEIDFIPCNCPIGFQTNSDLETDTCDCICDSSLYPYITKCDVSTQSLIRNGNSWINVVNSTNKTTFLIYPYCPFDYCFSATQTVYLNLNIPNGANAQCAFNRSEKLCGTCKPGLSLSLGSSHCLTCPAYWPALFSVIVLVCIIAGMALVIVILMLNLTVATGTLNGLIFYANIIFANNSILMPFQKPNFCTVFIHWLNLEFGLDVCFIQGLNAYTKTWIHLAFPIYVMLLVIVIILISRISRRFANIIGRRNPVATLATLLLLSYAKLLQSIIAVFSFASLHYPDHTEIVWLQDASVEYLTGKHIPLFIVAVIIMVFGIAYTVLLIAWQWLLPLSDRKMFHWVKNTKLTSFMDAHHAPYHSKSRYWTGLLLLVRVILYLSSALNLSKAPKVNLVSLIVVISFLLTLATFQIYKKILLNVLEVASYYNIIIFSVTTLYLLDTNRNHNAVAYTSVSISFTIFIIVIAYHVCSQLLLQSCLKYFGDHQDSLHSPLFHDRTQPQYVTYSEVEIGGSSTNSQNNSDSNRTQYYY